MQSEKTKVVRGLIAALSQDMNYTATVYKLKRDSVGKIFSEDLVESIVAQHESLQSIQCARDSCEKIRALRFKIDSPGDYLMHLDLDTKNVRRYTKGFQFNGRMNNYYKALAEGIVKILLFIYILVDFGLYGSNIYKMRKQDSNTRLSFEQKYLFLLNISMVMYFDPVFILHSFKPSVFT
jgi:tRNA U55 pseudouridine synthase TruB